PRRAPGRAGRELAQAHDARAHAQELVEAFDEVKPRRDPVDAPLRELARVVRLEAASARHARTHAREAEAAAGQARALERELAESRERNAQLNREVEELRREADEASAREQERVERQKSRRFGPRR